MMRLMMVLMMTAMRLRMATAKRMGIIPQIQKIHRRLVKAAKVAKAAREDLEDLLQRKMVILVLVMMMTRRMGRILQVQKIHRTMTMTMGRETQSLQRQHRQVIVGVVVVVEEGHLKLVLKASCPRRIVGVVVVVEASKMHEALCTQLDLMNSRCEKNALHG